MAQPARRSKGNRGLEQHYRSIRLNRYSQNTLSNNKENPASDNCRMAIFNPELVLKAFYQYD